MCGSVGAQWHGHVVACGGAMCLCGDTCCGYVAVCDCVVAWLCGGMWNDHVAVMMVSQCDGMVAQQSGLC